MSTIIVAQLLMIAVFQYWPQSKRDRLEIQYFEKNAIIVEEMIITRQANAPAAPPKPQMPVPVPNDEIIEEVIEFPELDDLISFDSLSTAQTTGHRGDEERISGNPDRNPRISRIVEPTYNEAAKNSQLKVMIYVNFLVNRNGIVREAYISEIRKFENNSDTYTVVNDLPYGMLNAVIEAAYKWRFRAAEEDGEPVGAYTQDVFTFGF